MQQNITSHILNVTLLLVLMLFLVIPSQASARTDIGEGGLWKFLTVNAQTWYKRLSSDEARQERTQGWHRGPSDMPLLEGNSILQSGKDVVSFAWMSVARKFDLSINDKVIWSNKESTKTSYGINKLFVAEVLKSKFDLSKEGTYTVKLTSYNASEGTTEEIPLPSKNYTLTVEDEGCLEKPEFRNLETQLSNSQHDDELGKRAVKATWLSSQNECLFEAYQQIVGEEESLKDIRESLALGTRL
ncbi:secreted protein [Beggiatoa sp. PS]|nr:secreted protein [Beggiatoa sp. PS]